MWTGDAPLLRACSEHQPHVSGIKVDLYRTLIDGANLHNKKMALGWLSIMQWKSPGNNVHPCRPLKEYNLLYLLYPTPFFSLRPTPE